MRVFSHHFTIARQAAQLIMSDNMRNDEAIELACSQADEFLDDEVFALLEGMVFTELDSAEADVNHEDWANLPV